MLHCTEFTALYCSVPQYCLNIYRIELRGILKLVSHFPLHHRLHILLHCMVWHCRGVSRLRALARLPVTAGHAALHRVYCTGLHCIFCSALGCTAYIVLHCVPKCITVYCTDSLSYCTVIVSNCLAHYLCPKDLSTLVSLAQNIKQVLFYRLPHVLLNVFEN